MVKAKNSVETNIDKAEPAFSHAYQALVVRAKLKRKFCKTTNMAHKLRASQRHITNVTSSDEQWQTVNKGICREFCNYFQKLHQWARIEFCLVRCLEAMETATCEGVHYGKRLKQSEQTRLLESVVFRTKCTWGYRKCLLVTVYDNWMKQGNFPQNLSWGIVKYLR